jgi:hypothetical protein
MKILLKQNKTIPAFIIALFAFYAFVGVGIGIANAAWTPVQKVDSTAISSTTNVITIPATTAGNLVVVYPTAATSGDSIVSVVDDVGNTYTVAAANVQRTNIGMFMAYGVQITGGATTITVTWGNNQFHRAGADEFHSSNGALTSNAATFDTSSTGQGTIETSYAVTTMTPAANGELIVVLVKEAPTKATTAGSGYTLYNGTGTGQVSMYKLSGTTSETAPATVATASGNWGEIALAFIEPTPASVVKTIRGLIRASVKTINGMAIASIKKFNGTQ